MLKTGRPINTSRSHAQAIRGKTHIFETATIISNFTLAEAGKTIKEYSLTAPDQNVITDQQEEPVARLLLSADNPFQTSVYPNPSMGEFTVETSKQKELTTSVSVMDMSGYKIYQQSVAFGEKLFVKLGSPKPGLYVLVVKNGSYERRQLIEIKY